VVAIVVVYCVVIVLYLCIVVGIVLLLGNVLPCLLNVGLVVFCSFGCLLFCFCCLFSRVLVDAIVIVVVSIALFCLLFDCLRLVVGDLCCIYVDCVLDSALLFLC